MQNKRGFFKKALCLGALASFLTFNPVYTYSQETKEKSPIEQTLENKVSEKEISKPKIDIKFNYETGSKKESIDHLTSFASTSSEEVKVQDTIKDIRDGVLNSYEDFVNATRDFSESQKIVLLGTIAGLLYDGNYDASLSLGGLSSQETFFSKLQDYLITGNQNGLGTCKQLASHIEKLGNANGIRTSAVSGRSSDGRGHVYVVSKIENGTIAIDGDNILILDTRNIEEALEAYQIEANKVAFQHLFFEDSNFKYRLITKDGKNFFDFIGYDETLEKLKNCLTQKHTTPSDIRFNFNLKDDLISAEIDVFGFFEKIGEIKESSSMNKMQLLQIGYERKFPLFDFIYITPNVSLTSGTILEENIMSCNAGLVLNTNNKEGLNLASRIAGNFSSKFPVDSSSLLFNDFLIETGVSYKILPIREFNIEPYLASQCALLLDDLCTENFKLIFNEIKTGIVFDIKINKDTDLSLEPYVVRRIWENEFGANIKFETKDFGIDTKGYFSDSTYDFCPDKWGTGIGAHVNLGNLKLEIKYGLEGTNYDGEIENNHSLSFNGNLKF